MRAVRSSLNHPEVTVVVSAVLVLVGLQALFLMERKEDPTIPWLSGIVVALYPGATAEQVEQQVARPIENQLFRFAQVKRSKTFSTSQPGIAFVQVELEDFVRNTDEFWSKLQHEMNEVAALELPEGVLGPIVDADFGDVSAILLAVQGDRFGFRELEGFADVIEGELRRIRALAKVRRLGQQSEEIRVTSTMDRLAPYGITPHEIMAGLQNQNLILESGAFYSDQGRVSLRTSGIYLSEDQIRRQIVGISPESGQPVYLGDFATVERRYADPDSRIRTNGRPALILSLEMHEGENIVSFGRQVDRALERLGEVLPPDLILTKVADQPRIVQQRVGAFLRDFGLAVLVVILVCMLLLPLRVAAIAATSIPVTIAATFALLQVLGIGLHQVSLAGLIVVLGMVVDDAIVITDNYVELLDQGVARMEAAYQAAASLAVPVVTATLTIVASFLPLAIFLPGAAGNFIRPLPVTVAVALVCSTVVAMLLTPLLCRAFIGEGVRSSREGSRFDPLESMQRIYDRGIAWAMRRKGPTMLLGLGSVFGALLLLTQVDEQFFPSAERDQFVINVWLPSGSRLARTEDVMVRIEEALDREEEVVSHASFVGSGAPRFYYNFDPPYPGLNVGQMIVNTTSVGATLSLVESLGRELPRLVPEAEIRVQELQQGLPTQSPIEARIRGPEIDQLRILGAEVEAIFRSAQGSSDVRSDYREPVFDVGVALNHELALRMGITSRDVAETLAGTLLGAPVSTLWEGGSGRRIVLRLDEERRESFDDVGDMYIVAGMTGGRAPLRDIAEFVPEWREARIVRRNGVRTLTVGSSTEPGTFPSALLRRVRGEVEAVPLPPRYHLEWGGEIADQEETFGYMIFALLVALVAIFLILLFRFGRTLDAVVVMVAIPLSLFGAVLGLVATGNPFGFTAFLGIISLSGIVVRNAIILLESIGERRAMGVGVEEAALEAGRRRLRPIFLTSVSAALGVTPMILSGSAMWAPLGSVLASGLLFSMVLTLGVVPVLYVLVNRDESGIPLAAPGVSHQG
jgi:multidrug efflux pump subunit AcrB